MKREICLCMALAAIGLSSEAWSADRKSMLRFGAGYAMPSGDLTETVSLTGQDLGNGTMLAFDGTMTIEPQDAAALTIGYEYRFRDRLGIDVTLLRTTPDVDGRLRGTYWINDSTSGELLETGPLDATEGVGDLTVTPVMLGLNVHLTPKSRLDFYLAPVVGYVFYGDLDLSGEKIALKPDFAWGATAGLDVPIGKGRWSFSGALRYLSSKAEVDEPGAAGDALDVRLFAIQVAAGYRF